MVAAGRSVALVAMLSNRTIRRETLPAKFVLAAITLFYLSAILP